MTKFRDLAIGDSFDFIGPDRTYNSFYQRCRKTSPRKYRDELNHEHHIGSDHAEVYHVIRARTQDARHS